MDLQQVEQVVKKAYFIDANMEYATILLVYHNEEDAIQSTDVLIDAFQSHELSIHIRYNEKISLSLISKQTADTINIDNLGADPMTTSVLDIIMRTIKNKRHPNRDYITLSCGCFKDGVGIIPSFQKSQIIGLANIEEMIMQFVK